MDKSILGIPAVFWILVGVPIIVNVFTTSYIVGNNRQETVTALQAPTAGPSATVTPVLTAEPTASPSATITPILTTAPTKAGLKLITPTGRVR